MAAYKEEELLSAGDIAASEDVTVDDDDKKKKKKPSGGLELSQFFLDSLQTDTPSIERPSKIQEEPVVEEEVVETEEALPPAQEETPTYEEPSQDIKQIDWDAGKQILTPDEEQQFQEYMQTDPATVSWQQQVIEETGAPPDINTGDYDYRAAWKAGVKPQVTNEPLEKTSEYAIKWTTPEADGRQLMSPSNPNRYRINPQVTLPPYAQMPDQIAEDELQRADTQGFEVPSLRQKVGETDYDAAQRHAQMAGINPSAYQYGWSDDGFAKAGAGAGDKDRTPLPHWVQAGINQSMIGMGKQIIDSGEPVYDLSNVELSTLENVGATVLALGVLDLPFFMVTGYAGGWGVREGAKLVIKGMQKRAVAQLVKNGAKEQVAERAVAMAIKNNPKIVNGLAATVSGMTSFGPYSGSMAYMGEKISAGQTGSFRSFDPEGSLVPEFIQAANDVLSQDLSEDARGRVGTETAIGTALGGSLGILSYGTGLVQGMATNAAQRLEIGTVGFISEVFLFSAGDSYLRGESVTWEKFEHAAFVVGGLKVGGVFRGALTEGKAPFKETVEDIGEVAKGVTTIKLTPEELSSLSLAQNFTVESAVSSGQFTTEAAVDYIKSLPGPERKKLLSSKKIPVTLKEKIVEIVTGKRPEFLQKISGVKTTENSDGTGSVTIFNERGEVLQIEQFSSSSRAKDIGTRIWQNIETAKKFADLAGLSIEKRGALENKMSSKNLVSSKVSEAMITLPEFRSEDQKKLVSQFNEISEQFVEREAKKVAEAEVKEPTEEVTEKVTEEVAPKEDVVEKVDVKKPAPAAKAAPSKPSEPQKPLKKPTKQEFIKSEKELAALSDKDFFQKVVEAYEASPEGKKEDFDMELIDATIEGLEDVLTADIDAQISYAKEAPETLSNAFRELQAYYLIKANRAVGKMDLGDATMYGELKKSKGRLRDRKKDAVAQEDYERAELYRKLAATIKKGTDKAFEARNYKKDVNKLLEKLGIEPIKGQVVRDKDVLYQKQDTELDKYWKGLLSGKPESQTRTTVRNYSSESAEAARLKAIEMLGEKNVGEIQQARDMRGQSEFIFSAKKPEAAPTPEAEPTLKGMVPYENIHSKKDLAVALEDIFNISKEKAQADAEIFDSVADTWAKARPGKTKEDWYKEKIAQIRQGLIGDEGILYQEVGPGLDIYETTTSALAKIKQNKATSQQWKSMLLKNGAKKEEMDFIGLNDFLLDNPKLTKEQISEFLSENKLEVIEVLKSSEINAEKKELDKVVGEIEELIATEIPDHLEELDAEYPYTPFSDVASTIADPFDKTQVLTSDALPGEKAFQIDFVKRAITAEDKALRVREMEKLSKNLGYKNIDDFIKDSMISYLENKKARSEEAFDTANRLGYLQEVINEGAKEIALVDYIRSLLPKDYKIKLERRPAVFDIGAKLISDIKSSLRTTYNEEKVTSADQLLGKGKVFSPEFREGVLRELDIVLRRSSLATQQNWYINTFINDNKPPTKDMFKVPEADDMEAMGAKLNLAGKELAPYEKYIDWSEKGEDGKPGVFKYLSSVGTMDKYGQEREMGLSSTSELVIDAFEKLKKAQERKRELRKKLGEEAAIESARPRSEESIFGAYSLTGGKKYREMLFLTPRPKQKSVTGGHWTEDNVMGHMRWDERSDIERNRVMHIAEIQSDWMNRGKAGGFKMTRTEKEEQASRLREIDKKLGLLGLKLETLGDLSSFQKWHRRKGKKWREYTDISNEIDNLRDEAFAIRLGEKEGTMPRLAFHKDWYSVVLQRAVKYAADNGFDRVTWDEGITEAIRSGGGGEGTPILTEVKVKLVEDGNVTVTYKGVDRVTGAADSYDAANLVFKDRPERGDMEATTMKGELENAFGKKAAKQILDAAKKGEWIKVEFDEPTMVGWASRRNFYDAILPSAAKKIGKKLNTQTGKTEVLTDAKDREGRMGTGFWFRHKEGRAPAHYIDITPQVKEYYSSSKLLRQDKKAAITFDKEGKAIISALTNPNFVSPLHELVHMFDSDLNIRDAQNVLDWAKEKTWNINTREKFARAFELYLEEGKAPNAKLKSVFEKFKTWLKDVYKGVIRYLGKDVKLTDTIRDIFDRVLTPEEKGRISEKIEDFVEGFGGLHRFAQTGGKGPLFQGGGKKPTKAAMRKAQIEGLAKRAKEVNKKTGIRSKEDLIEALKKEYPGNSKISKEIRAFIDANQDAILKKLGKVSVDIPEEKLTEEEARTVSFLRTLDAFEYGVPMEDIRAGKLSVSLTGFKAARTREVRKLQSEITKLKGQLTRLQNKEGLPQKEIDAVKALKLADRSKSQKELLHKYRNFTERKAPSEIKKAIASKEQQVIDKTAQSVKQSLKDTFNNNVSKAIKQREAQIAKGESADLDMLSANRIAKAVMKVEGDINYAIDSAARFLKGLDKNRKDKKVTVAKLRDEVLKDLGFDKDKDRIRQALGIEDRARSEIGELFDMLDRELANVPEGTDLGKIKTRIIEFASAKSNQFKATNLRRKELGSLIAKLKTAKTPDSLRESMEDLKELMKKIAARNIYQNLDKLHTKAKKNYKKNKFLDSSGFQNDVREFLFLKPSDIPVDMVFNYMDALAELSVSDRLPVTTASKIQEFNLATAEIREAKLQEAALKAMEEVDAEKGKKKSEAQEKLKANLKKEASDKIVKLDVDKSMLSKMGGEIYDEIKKITPDEMDNLSTGQLKVLDAGLTLLEQGRLAPKLVTDVLDKVIIPHRIADAAKSGMADYIKDEKSIAKDHSLLDKLIGLSKPDVKNKDKLFETLSRLSPDLLDKYFKNPNAALYDNIYRPLEAAHNEVQQATDSEGSELRTAYRNLSAPLIKAWSKISPRKSGELIKRTRANIKIDMLMKQIEFEAFGGEGNVFRKIFGKEGEKGLPIAKYGGAEAEAELLKDVYESLPRKDDNVDWKAVEKGLTRQEKKFIDVLRKIFDNELLEKAIDANLYGRGEPFKRVAKYSPRRRMLTEEEMAPTGEEQLKEMLGEASFESPVKSTKASATYDRTEKVPSKWLDLDALSNAHRAIFQVNRDYFLGRTIKQVLNAIDILEKGAADDSVGQRIYGQLKKSIRTTLKGEFSVSGTLGERRLMHLAKTRARHLALARPLRPIVEASTNMVRVGTHPEIDKLEVMKSSGELLKAENRDKLNAILADVKSPVLRRIGTYTGEQDASQIESGIKFLAEQGIKPVTRKVMPVTEGKGLKTRFAPGALREVGNRIVDFLQLNPLNQVGEAVNSTLIRAGDAHTVRLAWLSTLKTAYKEATGRDVDLDNFKSEMKRNPEQMKNAINAAERIAGETHILSSPLAQPIAMKRDTGYSPGLVKTSDNVVKEINWFLGSWGLHESMRSSILFRDMLKGDSKGGRAKSAWQLGGMMLGNMLYNLGVQVGLSGFITALGQLFGSEESKEQKKYYKELMRQLESGEYYVRDFIMSATQLILGKYGTFYRAGLAVLAESINAARYKAGLHLGKNKEYDSYLNSIAYKATFSDLTNDITRFMGALSVLWDGLEVDNIAYIANKVSKGENLTIKEREQYTQLVVIRAVMNLTLNLPFTGDINRVMKKEISKRKRKSFKRTSTKSPSFFKSPSSSSRGGNRGGSRSDSRGGGR